MKEATRTCDVYTELYGDKYRVVVRTGDGARSVLVADTAAEAEAKAIEAVQEIQKLWPGCTTEVKGGGTA
jgi:hypothetical protein